MVKTILLGQDPQLQKPVAFSCTPSPQLKRWCLVCIAPTISGVETEKWFKLPCAISPAMQASCAPNIISLNSNFQTTELCPFGSSDSWYLAQPHFPYTRWVLLEYAFYDHFPKLDCPIWYFLTYIRFTHRLKVDLILYFSVYRIKLDSHSSLFGTFKSCFPNRKTIVLIVDSFLFSPHMYKEKVVKNL